MNIKSQFPMNYLIKITILILISSTIALGQKSEEIKVKGIYEWFEEPEKKTIEFSFSENGKTCGPNTDFETIGEQFAYLKFDLLKDNEMAKKIEEVSDLSDLKSPYPKQRYSYEYNTIEEAKVLHDMADEAFAEKLKLYHHYKVESREEMLEAEYLAIQNAVERAEELAKKLGYKSVDLISINTLNGIGGAFSAKVNKKIEVSFETKNRKRKYAVSVVFKMN